jgi:hypothetical protein
VNALSVVLTSVLGAGGLSGVVTLLRLRTDKDASVVDTVGRGMLVLERLNSRLEADLSRAHEQWAIERAARLAVEAELAAVRRGLDDGGGG